MTVGNARIPAARLALVGLVLSSAVALSAAGWVRVGGPGGSDLGAVRFSLVLAGFLSTAVASHLWPARRVPLILGASLALLVALHGPLLAAGALAIWSAFYALVHAPAGRWARAALIAAFLGTLWAAPWVAWRAAAPGAFSGILTTALLASGFVIRSLLYAYEATAKREQMAGAGYARYLLYLLAAPLGIVHFQPVGFAALHRGLGPRSDPDLLGRGTVQMAQGLAYLAALQAGRAVGVVLTHPQALAAAGEYDAVTVVAAAHSVLLGFFLELAGHVHFMIGMMRVLGFDVPAGFNKPYLSRNILEFWRRWNTYFRDFLTTLAYYPIAARLKRRPLLAVLAGCAAVFVLSGTAHALIDLAGNPGGTSPERFAGRHLLFVVFGALVAAWMVRETTARSRRAGSSAADRRPAGPVPLIASAATTAVFVSSPSLVDPKDGLAPPSTLRPGSKAGRAREWTSISGARLREAGEIALTLTVFAVIYLFFRRPLAGATRELAGAFLRPPL